MRRLLFLILLALSAGQAAGQAAGAAAPGGFIVLCYHEVRSDVRDYPDPFAVDEGALVAQFAWLRGNGYMPVSLEDIVAARAGGKPLPARAVLLTFDDGYLSFYTRVYPLLRAFGYPAVLAVVGSWIDAPSANRGPYGEKGTVPDAQFPTWEQLREMAGSGLVEIASHTYDLHRGIPANPQGNLQPAATARAYDATTATYENDADWRLRVRADLARNADEIERRTGRRPRAIAWPYGSYNQELVRMAAELGSPVALVLGDGENRVGVPLNAVRRILLGHNPGLADFASEIRGPQNPVPLRAFGIDLDKIYSEDAARQERNLSALIDRIEVFRPTHVYLTATSDTNGDGIADFAYFPNRHLPVRADLFNRVAWQLGTRNDVKVFARLPVSGLNLSAGAVAEVFEDLARNASFDGVLFEEAGASEDLAQSLTARMSAFRAPMRIARSLGAGAPGTRIAHEPLYPGDPAKTVFLLDGGEGGTALARRMRALQLGGEIHFGHAPDRFLHDDPAIKVIAPAVSLRAFPSQTVQKE